YTEMVSTGALLHGDKERFLAFDKAEHPVALQVGGNDPTALAACAVLAQEWGYDEININVGCPSDRVQAARFGACLMAEPELVATGVKAMRTACDIPVTVKTRIGIDEQDDYAFVHHFIDTVANAGCEVFIVHARKAWLSGLSPKQNREIPPLRYDVVAQLKQDFPELVFVLNGGITDLEMAAKHLETFDGVMLGRAAYQNPYLLASVDQQFYGSQGSIPSRETILERMLPYIRAELAAGVPLKCITRHMLGLFQGQPGAKAWRRTLSEQAPRQDADIDVVYTALAHVLDQSSSQRLIAA
ncbi:MAG: tRNA dihydrouridine(20/20a) synthase DusA, partial [Salinisphaeraceae bacterium]|nr:tRNA dihydrouridine(20/20a) synthase DusA [Salinisphaeraceae bacterium]